MGDFFYTTTTKIYFEPHTAILVSEVLPDAVITEEEMRENNNTRSEIIEQPIPILLDIRKIKSITREARELAREDAQSGKYTASAFLVNDSISKFIAGIALGFNRPKIPLKVFTNRDKALDWLKQFTISNDKNYFSQFAS
jgi:hypothetical protein